MAKTAGVRFRQAGKIFYYDPGKLDLTVSDYVVVETSHGLAVGRVVIAPDQVIANESSSREELKPVIRLATPEDIEKMEAMQEKAKEGVRLAKGKVLELGLDMSIANGEYDLEGSGFTAYFTAQDRVDFRNLVRELSKELGVHVQLLQVGDRDRAKLVDGVDVCGERLCCSSWMTNFPSVSIRMAKEQDLPLNPQKISGVCGRLYCCLTFEYEDYKALRGTLPKVGAILSTPAGAAKVTGIDFNREVVRLVLSESRTPIEVAAIDFKLQHGVTIRPIELVRKIEGPYRPISEDQEAGRPAQTPRPEQRQARPPRKVVQEAEPVAAAAAAESQPAEGGTKRRRRRRRRGRGPGTAEAGGESAS